MKHRTDNCTRNRRTAAGQAPVALLLSLLFVMAVVLFAGCSDLPGSEDLTATPQITAPPTSAPTISVTTTPSLTPATPTPTKAIDLSSVTDGGCNACASWNPDGTLDRAASAEVGALIYANNFERDRGNRLAPGNSCNEADVYATDAVAYDGLYSYKISRRKQDYHGLSGLGFRLDERNGLCYADLVGKTLRIDCRVLYTDEGFGVEDTFCFALFDAYHTNRYRDYQYNPKDGEIMRDKNGNILYEVRDRFLLADAYPVRADQWTPCTFYVKITETDFTDGCLLLGTIGETRNTVGLYCSYYIDNLTITVVPDEEMPHHSMFKRLVLRRVTPAEDDADFVLRPVPEESDETPEDDASDSE